MCEYFLIFELRIGIIKYIHGECEFLVFHRKSEFMEHPWVELKEMLKKRKETQKSFSLLIWKKTSELNELIRGKRNITIQWDFLLYKFLHTPKGYRMRKQMLFDYRKFIQDLPEEEKREERERILQRRKRRKAQRKKIFEKF